MTTVGNSTLLNNTIFFYNEFSLLWMKNLLNLTTMKTL